MPSKLDEMFSAFEDRKQKEREEREETDTKHHEFREKAVSIINECVAPILQSISADLELRNHESQVSLGIEHDSYPRATLSFRVVSDDEPHMYVSPSKLTFATTTSEDKMEVRKEIWGAKGKDESPSYGSSPGSKALDEVSRDWVETQALSFVRTVLSKC